MSGITNAMSTALSGLELFQTGISTVSNNLANITTSGYSAETVNAQTQAGATGQPGAGVQPAQITRAASGFAAAQLRNANAAGAAASSQSTALTALSNALTNNGDVQTTLNQFFQDISTLASNPASTAQRQTVFSDAQSIISSFQSAAASITGTLSGAQETLSTGVTSANTLLGQLATINAGLQQSPNSPSLLDQQQAALNSLSQYLPVNAITQGNGSVIVTTGGTVLLDQSGAQALAVATTSSGTLRVTAGNNQTPVTLTEADGSLGAALGNIVAGNQATQSLGTLAAIFATQVNTAQAQGLNASGAIGQPLFSVPAPSVTPGAGNTGSAVITASIANAAALPTDGGPFTLTYSSATGWSAADQATGQSYSITGTPPSFAGLALGITGTPANGDSFVLNPAPSAATGLSIAATSASQIAAADPYVATPGTLQANGSVQNNNAGSITAGTDSVATTPATGAAVIPASYYGQNLQINFTSATAYTVSTTASPGTAIASGTLSGGNGEIAIAYPAGAASGQYWQLPISGTPVAGDTLTLTPGGSASGSNAQRLAALWTSPGTTTAGTLEQSVVGLSTSLGANAAAAQQLASATAAQVTTATSNLSTVAGVNSDQQAIALTNYEQAYQAAAQVISTAHTMFESLLTSI
ncbi:MAG: flagellar biosynthesis protein FlgK [Rhodospirillales bacterium]|nr:flagellar biosynthesis protein FlgK [Rhodospirillales bacterium]MDE1883135.1 flagellar biosynthesis protein FlgK [Rhodospirillales bacterium]MDE2390975.1 flagellar biosynthesis protein FlgK [Rhodospirillales bacterium]